MELIDFILISLYGGFTVNFLITLLTIPLNSKVFLKRIYLLTISFLWPLTVVVKVLDEIAEEIDKLENSEE